MLSNYLKIALRHLKKQKLYSAVTIGGFALSIAACLLITLYIRHEMSYDRSYVNGDRIYRVYYDFDNHGKEFSGADFAPPMARALKADFPEVENAGRLMSSPLFYGAGSNEVMVGENGQNIYEEGFAYADQEMIDILKLPMAFGDRGHALEKANSVVLSKTKADKYFPNEDPVGKLIYINNDKVHPLVVGGVMQDFPENSHLHYDYLISLKDHELWQGEQNYWVATNYPIYVLLKPGVSVTQLEAKFPAFVKKYIVSAFSSDGFTDAASYEKRFRIRLQPLKDINLYSYNILDDLSHSDIRFIWLFGAVALFILVLAIINFVNLSTARSANRAKEVGIRKVVGSYRSGLIIQFLSESVLQSFLSFFIAFSIALLLLPYFNKLAGKTLTMPVSEWWFIPTLIVSAFVIGMLAGLYPSFYLSGFNPSKVLKGELSRGSKNASLRNLLVVFQFTASIILIIATFIIYQQTQFILNRKMGFDKDQVMLIQGTNTMGDEKVRTLKMELQKLSQVKSVSISDYLPITGTKRNGNSFWIDGRTGIDPGQGGQFWIIDYDYLRTMGMHLISGRNFSPDMPSDTSAVIVNQSMVRKLGLKEPIGKIITNYSDGKNLLRIIGVVEDFNFNSIRQEIEPLAMFLGLSPSIVSVKVNTADMKGLISSVTDAWKKFSPNQPIRYTFMDESFANMYADVQRMSLIFSSFAALAIVIACLGLFALSAFMAEQRRKEIGIRKVLGASGTQVMGILFRDFVKLVLIAIVIATPISWWVGHKWLQNFEYRTPLAASIFLVASVVVILIAVVTISFQAVKAANENPVKSLRA